MNSESAIQQYRWKFAAGVILFSILTTLVLAVAINPSWSELAHASEQVVASPQCTSIWNCGASALLPPMALVAIGALVLSPVNRVSDDD